MYCSLTYTMGVRFHYFHITFSGMLTTPQNIALFSCLYNGHWDTPGKCNSSHSRLLGFFSCLPGIWRLLQCLRRYRDTKNAFPHLANAGKYACTVLYYVSLSLWRIDKTEGSKALFIAFGTVNSVYCCKFYGTPGAPNIHILIIHSQLATWDLAMDWSKSLPFSLIEYLN